MERACRCDKFPGKVTYLEYKNGRRYCAACGGEFISMLPINIPKEPLRLTPQLKYEIADKITLENRSKTDIVQDVFDEIMLRIC